MILAAGRGERMRPLTDTVPKPLLEVAGRPLIAWQIEALARAGFRDIVINAAHLADRLVAALGDGAAFGVRLSWSIEPEALETAGGIATPPAAAAGPRANRERRYLDRVRLRDAPCPRDGHGLRCDRPPRPPCDGAQSAVSPTRRLHSRRVGNSPGRTRNYAGAHRHARIGPEGAGAVASPFGNIGPTIPRYSVNFRTA
jgi:hypothetical protein